MSSYFLEEEVMDMMTDRCVHCDEELSLLEKTRTECWGCRDKISLTYSDDHEEY